MTERKEQTETDAPEKPKSDRSGKTFVDYVDKKPETDRDSATQKPLGELDPWADGYYKDK